MVSLVYASGSRRACLPPELLETVAAGQGAHAEPASHVVQAGIGRVWHLQPMYHIRLFTSTPCITFHLHLPMHIACPPISIQAGKKT